MCCQSCWLRSCEKTVVDNRKQLFIFAFQRRLKIDNFFSWTTKNIYLFAACVKTVIDKKIRRREKVWKSSTRKSCRQHLLWCVKLKENGFLYVTIMVCPQKNEPHSLPKGNPDNVHEADSTEKHRHGKHILDHSNWFVYIFLLIFLLTHMSRYII